MAMKKVIDRGKRNKKLSEVKLIENIRKNPQFSRDKSREKRKSFFFVNSKTMHMSNRIFLD